MSGIAGVVAVSRERITPELLQAVTASLSSVGPDGQQSWTGGGATLCHSLLCTHDAEAAARQPCSLDGQVWITADVRLDARDDLLRKLRSSGCTVRADSHDAVLLLHAYEAWGEACLDHLIGDFAFGIWDSRRQRLFCARDHFGVTPFYYACKKRLLLFSNVLNVLHVHPDVSNRLNETAIASYLLFTYNDDPATTTFADIQALPPAHCLTWSKQGLQVRRYWTPPATGDYVYHRRPETYVEAFRDVFRQAVVDRLKAPHVALTLSGGLDSTSVAAVAAQAQQKGNATTELSAYAGGFDWLLPDHERYYAGLVARNSGIPISYLSSEPFMMKTRSPSAWLLPPEPRFFLQPPPAFEIIEQAAAKGVRIVLTGLGGDPALQPMDTYWLDLVARGAFGRFLSELVRYVRANGRRPPFGLRQSLRRRIAMHHAGKSRGSGPSFAWLNSDFVTRTDLRDRMQARMHALFTAPTNGRVSMATNTFWAAATSVGDPEFSGLPVKVRHPFFDVRLVHFLQTVPPGPWFEQKRLLRNAMRGILPDAVRTRGKTPMATNFFHAFATHQSGPDPAVEALAALPVLSRYVDTDVLQKALRAPNDVPAPLYVQQVVLPLSLAFWLDNRHRLRDVPGTRPLLHRQQLLQS